MWCWMRGRRAAFSPNLLGCAILCAGMGGAWAQDGAQNGAQNGAPTAPLSAIDWLSDSVAATAPKADNASRATLPPLAGEAPVSGGLDPDAPITTTILGGPSVDAVGLLAPAVTGLPRALWGGAAAQDVAAGIAGLQTDGIPALQTLAVNLLLAEADAPTRAASTAAGAVLLARVDKLLAMGALDQAFALIEAAGPATNADLFRRAFDASLLMGEEDRACSAMRATRGLAIAAPARIFCAARAGDWQGAHLTLATETALGRIPEIEAELLGRFLDPDTFGDTPMPPPPKPVTPLIWRLYDALGETLPTGMLPIAFAHAELSPRTGWKAQAEAAERLARAGVLSPNQLLGVYTAQKPAASGGVWDRIAAFQAFEAAITAQDPARIAASLPMAYAAMKSAELEVPFADLYAEALASQTLTPAAQEIAFELGLLSPAYERLAGAAGDDPRRAFLAGLARGDVAGLPATGALARAVAAGFAAPPLPDDLARLVSSRAVGMAILAAISRIQTGVLGEDRAVTEGLALLRALGLESAARRTALELMILERRG